MLTAQRRPAFQTTNGLRRCCLRCRHPRVKTRGYSTAKVHGHCTRNLSGFSNLKGLNKKPQTSSSRRYTLAFRKPTSLFRISTSLFRRPTSLFRISTSVFRRPTSLFRRSTSLFRRSTSLFRRPTSLFRRSTSLFRMSITSFK